MILSSIYSKYIPIISVYIHLYEGKLNLYLKVDNKSYLSIMDAHNQLKNFILFTYEKLTCWIVNPMLHNEQNNVRMAKISILK